MDRRTQQLQLDFERQRALQAEQTRIQVKEQRLFEQAVTPRQSFLLGQAN